MNSKIIVAIDGYSSSGKSTMAKQLARAVGYRYIDSGAMYRAVTLYALDNNIINPDNSVDSGRLAAALPEIDIDFLVTADGQRTMLNGRDVEQEIRSMRVSSHVSMIAALPAVRHDLVKRQQAFGRQKGIVMDGRDIGTSVFPDAELKIFVDASAETRARRRYLELSDKGCQTTYEEVLANILERDRIDSTRAESPLTCAPGAIRLDNSDMTVGQQQAWLLRQFHKVADARH